MKRVVHGTVSSDRNLGLDDARHAVERSKFSDCRNPWLSNCVAGGVLGVLGGYLKIDGAALGILVESELYVVEVFDENTSWFGTFKSCI